MIHLKKGYGKTRANQALKIVDEKRELKSGMKLIKYRLKAIQRINDAKT